MQSTTTIKLGTTTEHSAELEPMRAPVVQNGHEFYALACLIMKFFVRLMLGMVLHAPNLFPPHHKVWARPQHQLSAIARSTHPACAKEFGSRVLKCT